MPQPLIILTDLPDGVLGYTDGVSRIWLDRHLTEVDHRATLAHELHHLRRGHRHACTAAVEDDIERGLARQHIDPDDLSTAANWSQHLDVIADELAIRTETLETHLRSLSTTERQLLDHRVEHAHWNL